MRCVLSVTGLGSLKEDAGAARLLFEFIDERGALVRGQGGLPADLVGQCIQFACEPRPPVGHVDVHILLRERVGGYDKHDDAEMSRCSLENALK